ncbi:DUF4974 domain-containing protein [Cellulophaga sp. 20_2_10]|uniref:FecR family protein n=1 Tax=Cellulophaga sp. 20_2_10 TaxID=2942476 RepID=UPI00201AC6F0|nr:FecR domain-containing protein [Cellulophaga sp. 20_2_10]MCL5246514.1 DUF4974 domain-containing protein [Cellulophaga sp. 20_2_10]
MKEFNAKKIIVKYLASEATATEKEQLYKWVEAKKNQKIFKEFVKAQQLIDIKYKTVDSESAFTNFLTKIKNDKKGLTFKSITPYLKYAALFAGVFLTLLYFTTKDNNTEIDINPNEVSLQILNGSTEHINLLEDKIITAANGKEIAVVKNGVLEYTKTTTEEEHSKFQNILTVPYGKTFKVVLADGSLVQLNSGSVLKYPNTFNKNEPREVCLEGEAFFNVSKDKNHSFLVSSKTSITKVFGTAFNVSTYSDNTATEIVLVEGSVGVKKKAEANSEDPFKLITPSQKASLTRNTNTFEITSVDTQKYIGWTNGFLIFENDRFDAITKILERHYNVSITNNFQEINKLRFNGSFQNDSIEKILNTIKTHTNFSFTRTENTITINNPKTIK